MQGFCALLETVSGGGLDLTSAFANASG